MDSLSTQQCSDISSEVCSLEENDISRLSQELDPPWQLDTVNKNISHSFEFGNYYQTMAFVNVVAQIAHQQDHHPDLAVSYKRCTVTYTTHSAGGLSIKDFICAAKINAAQKL
jgi:4a-hydroxytetrahydrobiopterin dehydratase